MYHNFQSKGTPFHCLEKWNYILDHGDLSIQSFFLKELLLLLPVSLHKWFEMWWRTLFYVRTYPPGITIRQTQIEDSLLQRIELMKRYLIITNMVHACMVAYRYRYHTVRNLNTVQGFKMKNKPEKIAVRLIILYYI